MGVKITNMFKQHCRLLYLYNHSGILYNSLHLAERGVHLLEPQSAANKQSKLKSQKHIDRAKE